VVLIYFNLLIYIIYINIFLYIGFKSTLEIFSNK